MKRATCVSRAGSWPAAQAIGSVTLPFDDRFRRRIRMTDDWGKPFLLDLADAVQLADGDGLALEDGGFIRVRAANEPVLDIKGRDAAHTARLAWHIGNRHTPVQVLEDGTLRIRDDHVLAEMVEGLGGAVARLVAPFQPEPGAYAKASDHHGHAH